MAVSGPSAGKAPAIRPGMATRYINNRSVPGTTPQGCVRNGVRTALLVVAMLVTTGIRSQAQVPTVSPAAQQAHAQITAYEGPATCIACHAQQAQQMFGSVHYQEMGETPNVANIDGPAGKGRNGGMVMNSYCGTPTTSSRATCATCHAGNGRIPSPQISAEQLANIDCMMCHQDAYKRVPAPPYTSVSFPGTNGTTHTIQAVVEDETGFDFIPDQAKMTMSVLDAARTVHLPTRASCLRCHANAGGSDGGKRGDISSVTANPPLSSDVHMSPQGANLSCANCHSAGGHRVMGRGVDLRPNDSADQFSCASCHSARPHGDYVSYNGTTRDVHASRVACQSCHIPAFAKDKSTEMERSWLEPEFSMAACRGQGGWLPGEVRASNVVPTYKWFDGTSLANVLGQVPVQDSLGEYVLALPNGSVQSPNAKLFPMKVHHSDSARNDATGLLIPHSTFKYFTSGDFAAAVAEGQALANLEGPASVVPLVEYQSINHGVESRTSALQCGACHSSYTTGGPLRMNLKADLGYGLKGPTAQICTQCHGNKGNVTFAFVHDKHVRDKRYDCSNCHNFSRPERGLSRIAAITPAAPSGPVATTVSTSEIQLVWADNSTTEQGFRIERSADGVSFAEIRTVAANITTVADSGLAANTPFFYRVRAYNASGTSDYSMIGRANTAATAQTPPPATPTGLTANASDARVTLGWNAASGATSYNVKRSPGVSGPFSTVASVSTTSYADTTVANGTTYYYVVSAVNAGGESANSAAASATPQVAAPATPTGLTASAGDARVTLGWNAASGATSYDVKRGTSASGPFSTIASVSTASYADTAVVNGTTYYYVVSAVNAGGSSQDSAVANATPQATPPTLPATPTGLAAAVGNTGVALLWNPASGATTYVVKRGSSAGGPFTTIASGITTVAFTDTTVVLGSTYYYVVSAVNAAGESPNSAVVSATLQAGSGPEAPTQMRAAAGDRGQITLEWEQSESPNIVQNKVYRATRSGGPYTLIATVSARQSFRDSRLRRRTTYYYVVTAVDSSGRESGYSAQASARTR